MTDIKTNAMQFEAAYNFLMPKLQNELSPGLTYHHAGHTQQVVEVTSMLCAEEDIGSEERLLLMTAALYHDAGFLITYNNHEKASCKVAAEQLPQFGFSPRQIDAICKLIMVTKLPQKPTNKLESILCDADLHYLGTDKFLPNAESLYAEFTLHGIVQSRAEWEKKQNKFLKEQRFFTPAARKLYEFAKAQNMQTMKNVSQPTHNAWKLVVLDIVLMLLGVLIAGFALEGFLVPNKFLDGGIMGLSLLIHEVYDINLAYLVILFNLPLLIISYFSIGRKFAMKTLVGVVLLGLCVYFIPYPVITSDRLLISIFGGAFLGLGIGLAMRAGSAIDGLEILAVYTVKRTSFTVTEIILAANILLFSVAAVNYGLEIAMYSVLTFLAATKMIDFVIEGIQAHTGVTIISGQSELIKYKLVNEMGRGITIYKGERGFLPGSYEVSTDCDIIFTVVSRLEMHKLKNLVYATDPKAFVFVNTIREASGGIIKRRHMH